MMPAMPPKRSSAHTMHRAGALRKVPTPAEAKLWAALRGDKLDGVNFRRQHAIGKYIVDFCSPKNKLVIELDGGQHTDLEDYDKSRTEYLESEGYHVLRFWNYEVVGKIDRVLKAIHDWIGYEH
jgi:very-short-patch-repair endonuclease